MDEGVIGKNMLAVLLYVLYDLPLSLRDTKFTFFSEINSLLGYSKIKTAIVRHMISHHPILQVFC